MLLLGRVEGAIVAAQTSVAQIQLRIGQIVNMQLS